MNDSHYRLWSLSLATISFQLQVHTSSFALPQQTKTVSKIIQLERWSRTTGYKHIPAMSKPASPTMWFDLPKEVQDHVLRYLFAGKTVFMDPTQAHCSDRVKGSSILQVSKNFGRRRQVLDAIARHSRLLFASPTTLNHGLSMLDLVQRSCVRSISLDSGYTTPIPIFHQVRAVFPQIEKVELNCHLDDVLPTLYFDRKAKLFQALRSNHEDPCQELLPHEVDEDESEHTCPLGCDDPVITPTAYSIEHDFAAGHIKVEQAQDLIRRTVSYTVMAFQIGGFLRMQWPFGVDVECSLGMVLGLNDCEDRFRLHQASDAVRFAQYEYVDRYLAEEHVQHEGYVLTNQARVAR